MSARKNFFFLCCITMTLFLYAQTYIGWNMYIGPSTPFATFGKDLIIAPGTTITNNGLFYVRSKNTFIASGAIITGTGTIIFDLDTTQTIDANGVTIGCNIIVNNPKNITLNTLTTGPSASVNNDLCIESSITFSVGDIITNNNKVVFNHGSSYLNARSKSHINGWCAKIGNTPFIFPVGDGDVMMTAAISAPSFSTDKFDCKFFPEDPDVYYDVNLREPSLVRIDRCKHWIINRTVGTSSVSVSLTWGGISSSYSGTGPPPPPPLILCPIYSLSDLVVARWDGVKWVNHGNGGTTGSVMIGTITTSGTVGSFSPFTLASISDLNPLPIELLNFDVVYNNFTKQVDVTWQTATEINNAYFTIERSVDGQNWEYVKQIVGAGNSSSILSYASNDETPYNGLSYYRLKQTDVDGRYTYSLIRDILINNEGSISAYPIPFDNNLTVLLENSASTIEIINSLGQIVLSLNTKEDGRINLNTSLMQAGIYTLRVTTSSNVFYKQILKK